MPPGRPRKSELGRVRRQKGERRRKPGPKPGQSWKGASRVWLVVYACLEQLTTAEKKTLLKLLLKNLHLKEKL